MKYLIVVDMQKLEAKKNAEINELQREKRTLEGQIKANFVLNQQNYTHVFK